jgi:Ca-activated chloride channel homolog
MRICGAAAIAGSMLFAQNTSRPVFRANVHLVTVSFRVTDGRGKAVAGLKPTDVRILENAVPQRIAAFFENDTPVLCEDSGTPRAGASVFVLFDTSNRMYTIFPYVYDAIAGFVRQLDPADSVAIYSFSRNLFRAARLTNDHVQARAGLENIVAGDDTALFSALLLTLRDAAKVPGRRAVVVFSNGPDNASMVAPDDVGRVAEDEGIPVYVVSTLDRSKAPEVAEALDRLTERTGGKTYWASRWQDQAGAFESIQRDIRTSYTAYYYPAPDWAPGYRQIEVKITAPGSHKWHVSARAGYDARLGTRDIGQP